MLGLRTVALAGAFQAYISPAPPNQIETAAFPVHAGAAVIRHMWYCHVRHGATDMSCMVLRAYLVWCYTDTCRIVLPESDMAQTFTSGPEPVRYGTGVRLRYGPTVSLCDVRY
eukprot:3523312-Rhodomonas_salina.4